MTIDQLINKLKGFPGDLNVYVNACGGDFDVVNVDMILEEYGIEYCLIYSE